MSSIAVIVNGPRISEVHVGAKDTAGAVADAIAREHGVDGQEFSLKVAGDVLSRSAALGGIAEGAPIELVEVTDFEWPEAAPAVEDVTTAAAPETVDE